MNESLLFLIPLLPLCCAVINMVFGMRLPRLFAEVLAVMGVAGAFVLTVLFWGYAEGEGTRAVLFTWLSSGSVDISFALNFDRLAAPMTLMVTSVASLAVNRTGEQVASCTLSPLCIGPFPEAADVRGGESFVQLGASAWVETSPGI